MSKISKTEIYSMTKEQNYMRGYRDGKSDILDKIRSEIESVIQEETVMVNPEARNGYESVVSKLDPDDVFQIIDKYMANHEDKDKEQEEERV